jgi:hypothetical protein
MKKCREEPIGFTQAPEKGRLLPPPTSQHTQADEMNETCNAPLMRVPRVPQHLLYKSAKLGMSMVVDPLWNHLM